MTRRWDLGPNPAMGAALPWLSATYPGTEFALMFDRRWEYLATFERLYGIPAGADPDGADTADRILAGKHFGPLMRSAGYLPFTSTDGIRIALESVVGRRPTTDIDRWVWFREGIRRWIQVPVANSDQLVNHLAERITDYGWSTQEDDITLPVTLAKMIERKGWKKGVSLEIQRLSRESTS